MELTDNQKMYAEVINKAWEDEAFKNQLVADPVAAIEELTGCKVNVPEGKKIVVRDQTDENKVFINIPAKPQASNEDVELNEEQLEKVSGGYKPGRISPKPGFGHIKGELFSPLDSLLIKPFK